MTAPAATSKAVPNHCLDGIVVVERADRLAVSVCGSLLAELGATVLQVTGSGHDIGLTAQASIKASRLTALGKTCVKLDESNQADSWKRLVERSDVVVIGYDSPADAELLAKESSRRIVCALSAFGTDAPTPTTKSDEMILQAAGGLMAATGAAGGAPESSSAPVIEMMAAINAATAILAALRMDGRGSLDIAGFDSAIALLSTYVSTVVNGRVDGYRVGCGHHLCSPWNVYQAADGWVQICSTTDEQWHALLRLVGRADLINEPSFTGSAARLDNIAAVDDIIGTWTTQKSVDELVQIVLGIGLPVGKVRTVSELTRDVDLTARGMVAASSTAAGSGPRPGSFIGASFGASVAADGKNAPVAVETALASLGSRERYPAQCASTGKKPLEGIRAIELGAYTAGPLAGRYLADLGAEVIKVEAAGGEISRKWVPQFGGHSGYFANCNIGKKSIVLDLKSDNERTRLLELLMSADVLMENLRPGALDKIGLGPKALLRLKPRLVYCSLSGFGRAAGSRPALDTVVQAEAGMMWLVGDGGRPQRVGISLADQAAAHAAPLLILAALRGRDLSGEGRHIDLSMQDVLAWMIGLAWPDGEAALSPWATLAVSDGWIVARDGTRARALLEKTGAVTRQDAIALLATAGTESACVLEMGEVMAHESVRRRNLIQWVPAADGAKIPVLSAPQRVGGTPFATGPLPSAAGADNDKFLSRAKVNQT